MERRVKKFGYILLFLQFYGMLHAYVLFPAVLLFGARFRFSWQQWCLFVILIGMISWFEYHYPRKKRIIHRLEKENERLKRELKELAGR
jgi:hypothetical protein